MCVFGNERTNERTMMQYEKTSVILLLTVIRFGSDFKPIRVFFDVNFVIVLLRRRRHRIMRGGGSFGNRFEFPQLANVKIFAMGRGSVGRGSVGRGGVRDIAHGCGGMVQLGPQLAVRNIQSTGSATATATATATNCGTNVGGF